MSGRISKVDSNKTIINLFYERVGKHPGHIAVADELTQLSYQALNEKSNQVARYFLEQGIKPQDFVGTLLHAGVDFIVVLLAILKVGATALPLDISSPEQRLHQIINESKPKLIVSDIDELYEQSIRYSKENINQSIDIKIPVFLIYTSGSTGKPKGVLISNIAVVNLSTIENTFKIKQRDIFAQFSNPMFDGAIFEIWTTLLNGAKLVIVPPGIKKNFIKFSHFLEKNEVGFLFLPTSYFHLIAKSKPHTLDKLKGLMIGGEQVNANLLEKFIVFRKKNRLPITLINGYGPTETTAYTCYHSLDENSPLNHELLSSIGVNICNSRSYILDEEGNLAREGELYISGVNLALGYFGDEGLTKKRFTCNPFSQDKSYQRLYKTGDRVRRLPCGKLLFLGRLDDQVKVRGFRVHLSEIETQLMHHPDIIQATVLSEEDNPANPSHKRLFAYMVVSNPFLKAKAIRQFLRNQLPSYMIPAKYFAIEELPLTFLGKIDKKRINSVLKVNLDYLELDTKSLVNEA